VFSEKTQLRMLKNIQRTNQFKMFTRGYSTTEEMDSTGGMEPVAQVSSGIPSSTLDFHMSQWTSIWLILLAGDRLSCRELSWNVSGDHSQVNQFKNPTQNELDKLQQSWLPNP